MENPDDERKQLASTETDFIDEKRDNGPIPNEFTPGPIANEFTPECLAPYCAQICDKRVHTASHVFRGGAKEGVQRG
jgi:hypothetical protein